VTFIYCVECVIVIHQSTDSLVDVTNRFDGLTDEEEGEVLTPSIPKQSIVEQSKRVRVPSITIKWELTRVRSEIVLSNMKNNCFLLKQIHGGTLVKIATMDEYDTFLKRKRQVSFLMHPVKKH
jgi:hypothetical protein